MAARKLRTDAKGSAMESRGKFLALVPLGGGDRFERVCPSAASLDDARRRAEQGTEIVRALYAVGREADVAKALEQIVDAPAAELAAQFVDAWRRVAGGVLGGPVVKGPAPPPAGETFEKFAKRWTDGELHRAYPDHVGALDPQTAADYAATLRKYINPTMGPLPLAAVTLDHALDVMRKLPEGLSQSRRRNAAQTMHRVLAIATFPARVIPASPLPRGFLPKVGPGRAKVLPEIAEEAALLALPEDQAPIVERLLLGFLAREGCRKEDAAPLEWSDTRTKDAPGWIDLAAGKVYVDQHKTLDTQGARDPWRLQPDVLEALRRWRKLHPKARRVFPGEGGALLNVDKLAERQRAYYLAAGAKRLELHESTATRRRLFVHDLRALFCTLAFARGESEGWITARTGHTTSTMLAKYRRAAASFGEGGEAVLAPLHLAIPELRKPDEQGPGEGADEPPEGGGDGGEGGPGSPQRSRQRPPSRSKPEQQRSGDSRPSAPMSNESEALGSSAERHAGSSPARRTSQAIDDRETNEPSRSADGSEVGRVSAGAGAGDVEAALAYALRRATDDHAWDVVAMLATELRERRLAAAGVADLGAERARRGTR